MARRVEGSWWSLILPDAVGGGEVRHTHSHLDTMAIYRGAADDGFDLEVIVTTYPGEPLGERGQPLGADGEPTVVPGAVWATRRDQVTQLDEDPGVPPVRTIVVVAAAETASICLVVHRPLDAPAGPSERVARSLRLGR